MTTEEFRTIRKQLGLTQAGLAERLGVTERSIKRIEKGTQAITRTIDLLLDCIQHHPQG